MPSAIPLTSHRTGITRLTNCRLLKSNRLIEQDLWLSSVTGRILHSQQVFYEHQAAPDRVIDLGGRIVSPGFIDVQLNGAFGFDFSQLPENATDYVKGVQLLNKKLVETGVTSYLPTITSQKPEVYHTVLPHLGATSNSRNPYAGAESLGAHVEGPFLSPTKNGIHNPEVLLTASTFTDLESCYGAQNLSSIKLLTAAPEHGNMNSLIPALVNKNIIFSIGHTESTYEQAMSAVTSGAKMITHLFNAMKPLHHRNPGVFGILGQTEHRETRPYFGLIADGIHLHPTTVKIAYMAHPSGMILVTDAMSLAGLPDGVYDWTNGDRIVKKRSNLTLEGTEKIAGGCATLLDCVNNFLNWAGVGVPEAVGAVTATPAKMLGLEGVKGSLDAGADADLLVLSEKEDEQGQKRLAVDQVWKFGNLVHDRI